MTSGTQISYYHLCHRKLWFHHAYIRMENATANAYVEEGKHIDETTYARRPQKWRELNLGYLKIDHYDPTEKLIREVKKSPKLEHAHVAQVKYYLYALEKRGVTDASGIIEYPKHRKTTVVPPLTERDRREIEGWLAEIERITALPDCPELVKKSYCRNCAFNDFCFV